MPINKTTIFKYLQDKGNTFFYRENKHLFINKATFFE